LKRILLVLALTAMMVVMALPSAGAQPEKTKYCVTGGINSDFGGPARCYETFEQCAEHLEEESASCSVVPMGDIILGNKDFGQTADIEQADCAEFPLPCPESP
jgi:hypothetical protein